VLLDNIFLWRITARYSLVALSARERLKGLCPVVAAARSYVLAYWFYGRWAGDLKNELQVDLANCTLRCWRDGLK
jgi:hypothetical protein